MGAYEISLLLAGIAVLGAAVLPRLVSDEPLSLPMLYIAGGFVLFSLPLGLPDPDPVQHVALAEHLAELVVIVALMGAGLKMDRPFQWRAWGSTWRLLAVTMPLTIGAVALLAWGALGVLPATALLLGAVLAPTDPVLASNVQASPPLSDTDEDIDPSDQEGKIRFALTSEAGLNDGLAFPFTNLAIAMAAATAGSLAWLAEWALVDVGYKIAVGVVAGYLLGQGLARVVFGAPSTAQLARVMEGAEALAATLITYGLTELAGGYGFIAVFVAALELRHFEWEHDYYRELHNFAVVVERVLMAAVLVVFGGAIAAGLLGPLTWVHAAVGLAIVLVVRPVAGFIGLLGFEASLLERGVIASYGIRGVGSFYYLAHALNEAGSEEYQLVVASRELWALVGFVILVSVVVHGATASRVMNVLDRRRTGEGVAAAD